MTELLRAPGPGAEGLTDHLRDRWSISVFDDAHTLAHAEIETLLHAAQWAPSAGNAQPWAFFVAERGNAAHRVLVSHLSRGNSGWVPRASVVFLAAAQVGPEAAGGRDSGSAPYAYYALGQAAAHLSVQAASMGLWVHQFAGFDATAVAAELGVPPHFELLTGIAVGVRGNPADVSPGDAAREERDRVRKPLDEFVYGDRWGRPWH